MEYNDAAKIIQRRFRKRWFNHYIWNTYYKNNIQISNENGLLTCFIRLPLKDNFYRVKKFIGYIKAIENLEFSIKLFEDDSD